MSDALDYLMQVRGDAMRSYFDFIKKSGTHLDKKTRAIISVITKVDNQTESGFRQYLVRALQAGVTPNEILDALFVAFPTLGLSKIIWAVDQILALDIPEFRADMLDGQSAWHSLGKLDDIPRGVTRTEVNGRELFIYRDSGDQVRVYDSHCPHQVTNIPFLALSGNVLTCPKHGWKFDITSGECIDKGDRPLRQYQTRVEDGELHVRW